MFLCSGHDEHELPKQQFLHVTKGSLSLFPSPRRNFGVLQLSFLGIVLSFTVALTSLTAFLGPNTLAVFWLLLPAMVAWMFLAWPWAVRVAFRYSRRNGPKGTGLRFREAKFGLIHHRIRVESDGRKLFLIITGRRQTVADAIQLAKTRN